MRKKVIIPSHFPRKAETYTDSVVEFVSKDEEIFSEEKQTEESGENI